MSQADIVSREPCLKEKHVVRESINKIKSVKDAGTLVVVSEIVKAVREAGLGMITDLVNQIIGTL